MLSKSILSILFKILDKTDKNCNSRLIEFLLALLLNLTLNPKFKLSIESL